MRYLPVLIGMAISGITPDTAHANFHLQYIYDGVDRSSSYLPTLSGGFTSLNDYLFFNIFPMFRTLFIGVATVMFLWYAATMLLQSGEDNTVTEAKEAFEYAIFGAFIISVATLIVDAFGGKASVDLINDTYIKTGLNNAIDYIKALVATSVTLHIVVQGFLLIMTQGDEGKMEEQKKRFLYGILGVAMILLVEPIINAIQTGSNSNILAKETQGIANYLLVFFGALSIIAVIAGGVMMIISTDENLKEKAKKTISGAIIALVVVMSAYSIVNYFLTV
jgi:uncharacterized membrane protein